MIEKKIKPKKCKVCQEQFTPTNFNRLSVVCSKKCEIEYNTQRALKNLANIKKTEKKEWLQRKETMSINAHSQKHKTTLQNEINKLARMIDNHCGYFTCIDCEKSLEQHKQIDGAHYHPVKGNENIRYNLLNIHSARSECNQHDSQHHTKYKKGIEKRYGEDFFNYLENEIRLEYKSMHFSNVEIYNAIKIVRKLQRDLKTFVNTNSLDLRRLLNEIIGLYKKK